MGKRLSPVEAASSVELGHQHCFRAVKPGQSPPRNDTPKAGGKFMAELRDKFEAANVIAMWDQELRPNLPLVPSHIWRWQDVNPLIGDAANAVNMEDAERRVLILRNPGLKGPASGAAPNLSVNLQVLMPGEKARPHRHTMHALRFVLEGKGAVT